MRHDRSKVLEAAQRYASRGQLDKAILEYRKLVDHDPSDVRTWLNIGDLHSRQGEKDQAVETYLQAAAQYESQSFFRKALAVYKTILKLDPRRLDVQVRLAEMFTEEGLVSDALATYEQVARGQSRAGDIHESLRTMARMVELDGSSIPVRIKYAEALSKAGRVREAASEFEAGAALLKEQGRTDDYIKVSERLLYHRAEDTALARELAELYLDKRDPKRALSKLQLCFKADPKNIPTLELLAKAFEQLGQLSKTVSVYKEVARIHEEARRMDARARVLKRILDVDPEDAEARQALASYAPSQPSYSRGDRPSQHGVQGRSAPSQVATIEPSEPSQRPPTYGSVSQSVDASDPEILLVDPSHDSSLLGVAGPGFGSSVPPDVRREAQIARLLTECDVFLRYGLRAKVAGQLRKVLRLDPNHVEARSRLTDLLLEDQNHREAVPEMITLADQLATDRTKDSIRLLRQALEIDPTNAEIQGRLQTLSFQPPAPDPSEPPAHVDEASPVYDAGADRYAEPQVDGTLAGAPPPFSDVPPWPDSAAQDPAPYRGSQLPVVDRPAPSGAFAMPEAPSAEAERLLATSSSGGAFGASIAPPPPVGPATPSYLEDPLAPMTPEEFDEVPLRPTTPGEIEADAAARSRQKGEVEELLDEADFYVTQGLYDEALGTLLEGLEGHPQHPLILDKLRELDETAASASQSRPAPERPEVDHSFLLAEKLAEGFEEVVGGVENEGSDVLDVDAVFEQFKRGVEEQVDAGDTDTHFDLGIAYKEMGLLDDAIREFELCLQDLDRTCISETMIGLCYLEKNEVSKGIRHFKQGLNAERKTDREELGLYFELGQAYQLLGDSHEALFYYRKVEKRDPEFRQVRTRIAEVQGVPPLHEVAPLGRDELDRAFDDLLGED